MPTFWHGPVVEIKLFVIHVPGHATSFAIKQSMKTQGLAVMIYAVCSVSQSAGLPRSTPEAQGVSSAAVLSFVEAVDQIDTMNSFMAIGWTNGLPGEGCQSSRRQRPAVGRAKLSPRRF